MTRVRRKKPLEHCWHHTNVTFTSYPPQHDERCCWCGKVRRVMQVEVLPSGHGPNAPPVWGESYVEVGPCVRRGASQ